MAKEISTDNSVVDVCDGKNPGKRTSKTEVEG